MVWNKTSSSICTNIIIHTTAIHQFICKVSCHKINHLHLTIANVYEITPHCLITMICLSRIYVLIKMLERKHVKWKTYQMRFSVMSIRNLITSFILETSYVRTNFLSAIIIVPHFVNLIFDNLRSSVAFVFVTYNTKVA